MSLSFLLLGNDSLGANLGRLLFKRGVHGNVAASVDGMNTRSKTQRHSTTLTISEISCGPENDLLVPFSRICDFNDLGIEIHFTPYPNLISSNIWRNS